MRLVWTKRAIADLVRVRNYIEQDNPKAASELAHRILGAVNSLTRYPAIGRAGKVPGTRELVIAGTPYYVPYRIQSRKVELLRVLHSRRERPDKP